MDIVISNVPERCFDFFCDEFLLRTNYNRAKLDESELMFSYSVKALDVPSMDSHIPQKLPKGLV